MPTPLCGVPCVSLGDTGCCGCCQCVPARAPRLPRPPVRGPGSIHLPTEHFHTRGNAATAHRTPRGPQGSHPRADGIATVPVLGLSVMSHTGCPPTPCGGQMWVPPWSRSCNAPWGSRLSGPHSQSPWTVQGGTSTRDPVPGAWGRQAVRLQVVRGWPVERSGLGDSWEVPQAPEAAVGGKGFGHWRRGRQSRAEPWWWAQGAGRMPVWTGCPCGAPTPSPGPLPTAQRHPGARGDIHPGVRGAAGPLHQQPRGLQPQQVVGSGAGRSGQRHSGPDGGLTPVLPAGPPACPPASRSRPSPSSSGTARCCRCRRASR